jgi:hypothetical protein
MTVEMDTVVVKFGIRFLRQTVQVEDRRMWDTDDDDDDGDDCECYCFHFGSHKMVVVVPIYTWLQGCYRCYRYYRGSCCSNDDLDNHRAAAAEQPPVVVAVGGGVKDALGWLPMMIQEEDQCAHLHNDFVEGSGGWGALDNHHGSGGNWMDTSADLGGGCKKLDGSHG